MLGRGRGKIVLLVAALVAWLCPAARAQDGGGAAAPGFEPARTWVFAVGILEWQDAVSFGSFPKEGRRDAELVELFRSRGVPAEQVVFLVDDQATHDRIGRSLNEMLGRTRAGDLLFVYYAGHGTRTEDGTTFFVPFDARGDVRAETYWAVPRIFGAIERHFQGDRALLAADCCYSGALAVEGQRRNGRVSYACLSSSQASTVSTGKWTFTECLLAGLRGRGLVDLNSDGDVTLDELARYTETEMAFCDEQLSSFGTTGSFAGATVIARAEPRPQPPVGEHLEVSWQGDWYRAVVIAADGARVRIHYIGYPDSDDEWVPRSRTRNHTPRRYAPQTAVEVEWHGRWYPATVLEERLGLHRIHYTDYSDVWDEWVASARIRPAGRARRG